MEKLIAKIEKDGIEDIITIAVNEYVEGFESVVHYNPETDSYTGETWTSSTFLNPESSLIEVYRLEGNWIANSAWEVNDILDDEEYKELLKKVAEKENIDLDEAPDYVDFTSQKGLDLIGVDFKKRLIEFLMFSKDEIETEILRDL